MQKASIVLLTAYLLVCVSCSDNHSGDGTDALSADGLGGSTASRTDGSTASGGTGGTSTDGGVLPDSGGNVKPQGEEIVLEAEGNGASDCTARWDEGSRFSCSASARYTKNIDASLIAISDGRAYLGALYIRGPMQKRAYDETQLLPLSQLRRDGNLFQISELDFRVLEVQARPGPDGEGDEVYDDFSFKLYAKAKRLQ